MPVMHLLAYCSQSWDHIISWLHYKLLQCNQSHSTFGN